MKSNHRVLFLVVLSLLVVAPVLGQTHRASLRGTIYDRSNALVQGAKITLTNIANGESRTTTSNDKGAYAIASLPAGVYQFDIESSGFTKLRLRIELLVNQEQRQDVTLEVQGIIADPVVATFREPLKKDTPSLGTVIENRQVTGLPLDGRNFYELSLLVPGAVPPAQGSAGSVRGDFAFSVNGAREDANNRSAPLGVIDHRDHTFEP